MRHQLSIALFLNCFYHLMSNVTRHPLLLFCLPSSREASSYFTAFTATSRIKKFFLYIFRTRFVRNISGPSRAYDCYEGPLKDTAPFKWPFRAVGVHADFTSRAFHFVIVSPEIHQVCVNSQCCTAGTLVKFARTGMNSVNSQCCTAGTLVKFARTVMNSARTPNNFA